MKKVIIAEKPSVAKNIADAFNIHKREDGYFEGEDYIVSWAFGHLLQLFDAKDYDENMKKWEMNKFPFIPGEFKYKIKMDSNDRTKTDPGAKKQLMIIKKLISRNDVDGVISATDQDREGEVISSEIFKFLGVTKPIYRILLNEWTPEEVKKGMQKLKPDSEMKNLQDAGVSRQCADWIIGINLTSVATLKYSPSSKKPLNIGRVLLPTLKIVYDRDMEIKNFKPSTYYKLLTAFKTDNGNMYEGLYIENETDKFKDSKILEQYISKIDGHKAKIIEKQVNRKRDYAPYLFNLSNLQGYVTSKYAGWTSDKVLKVAQSLYEKKYLTYPRTGSICLEESLKDKTKKVLEALKVGLSYEKQLKFTESKRIFDNSKVESHSAITPTYLIPNMTDLTPDEAIVYESVKNRFLMQFMPIAEYDETKIITKILDSDIDGAFLTKGKIQIVEGWKLIEKVESKDVILPNVAKNEIVLVSKGNIGTVITKPPALHNEKTLLRSMETCGKSYKNTDEQGQMMASILSGFSIGTPATRAETIKKLKDTGYIKASGKSLTCTELGRSLVETIPAKELLDLEYTGKLEKTLSDIEKGKFKKKDFLTMIYDFTINSVNIMKNDNSKINGVSMDGNVSTNVLGVCPGCGCNIYESKKYFLCEGYKKNGCNFIIPIDFLGNKITKTEVKKILSCKETKEYTFKKGTNEWKDKLTFDKSEKKITYATKVGATKSRVIADCPNCSGKITFNGRFYKCENYKNPCTFIIPAEMNGAKITEEDVLIMLDKKVTEPKTFKWKSGNTGTAKLKYTNKLEYVF